MTAILESLSELITKSGWLAPLLALLAGVLTSFTPCSLSSIPLVIGYVGGTGQRDTKRAFWLSITFAAGAAVTFTTLGVIASMAGKLMFISVRNKLISCRDELFENFETVKKVIFDTTGLDKELTDLQSEMTVVAEMIQKCVDENARTKVDQEDYRKRYEGLVNRFETARARLTEVTELCKDKMVRREMTESFIAELRKQNELVSEFDERLWHTLLDYVTVYTEKDVRFTFKDGTIISA